MNCGVGNYCAAWIGYGAAHGSGVAALRRRGECREGDGNQGKKALNRAAVKRHGKFS
jgi:hypothetical protein